MLDVLFAYLAIMPIIQSKFISSFLENAKISEDILVIAGGIVAIFVGVGLTLLGRGAKNCAENKLEDNLVYLITLIVPGIYWLHYFTFSDRETGDFTYAAIFSFISLIVQILIIKDYPKHVEALAYFKTRKERDTRVEQYRNEINTLTRQRDSFIVNWNNKFRKDFGGNFRKLADARREYIRQENIPEEPQTPPEPDISAGGSIPIPEEDTENFNIWNT